MIDILIRCSFLIAPGNLLYTLLFLNNIFVQCYVTFFKQYFCAMLCVYAYKQLVGENEIDYHLSAQN